MMRISLWFPVAAMLVLAGCVNDPVEQNTDPDEGPVASLSDLVCELTYPDNQTPVECENTFTEITASGASGQPTLADDQLVCLHEAVEETMAFSVHLDPATEQYHIYYVAHNVTGDLNGIFYTRNGEAADGNLLVNWYDGPAEGIITLPDAEFEQTQQFVLRFYTHSFESPTPELSSGTIRAYWSVHNDRPYPLQVVETGDGTFYFNQTDVDEGDPTYPYSLRPFQEVGTDFNITVEADHVQNFRQSFNHTPHTPLTSPCTQPLPL